MPERAYLYDFPMPNRHEIGAIAALVGFICIIIAMFSSHVSSWTKLAAAMAIAYLTRLSSSNFACVAAAAPFAVCAAWLTLKAGASPFAAIIMFAIAGHIVYDIMH